MGSHRLAVLHGKVGRLRIIDADAQPEVIMELADVEAFLVLADELHFGHTAERTYVSPARVSQRIRALEHEVGAALFERTSRRVRLTPLGEQLRGELEPAYQALTEALVHARSTAREMTGRLRIGFTMTTAGKELDELVIAFERAHPDFQVALREVPLLQPLTQLRSNEIDVLIDWQIFDEQDLTIGPTIARFGRALAVGAEHPLAGRDTVTSEVLGDYPLINWGSMQTLALWQSFAPKTTPTGRPVRSLPERTDTLAEAASLVARGLAVHPTVTAMSRTWSRDDIVLVPITDMPSIPLGLIWCTAHENARIRALAEFASTRSTEVAGSRSNQQAERDDGSPSNAASASSGEPSSP